MTLVDGMWYRPLCHRMGFTGWLYLYIGLPITHRICIYLILPHHRTNVDGRIKEEVVKYVSILKFCVNLVIYLRIYSVMNTANYYSQSVIRRTLTTTAIDLASTDDFIFRYFNEFKSERKHKVPGANTVIEWYEPQKESFSCRLSSLNIVCYAHPLNI